MLSRGGLSSLTPFINSSRWFFLASSSVQALIIVICKCNVFYPISSSVGHYLIRQYSTLLIIVESQFTLLSYLMTLFRSSIFYQTRKIFGKRRL